MVRRRQLTAGRVISENQLAKQLELGRTPVREAVVRLVHEGLLVTVPKRGLFVRLMTAQEVRDLYEVRLWLEALAVGLAAQPGRLSSGDIDILEGLLVSAEQEIDAGGDPERLHELDREFHFAIWSHCGNARLQRMLVSLLDAAELDPLPARLIVSQARSKQAAVEHQQILTALADHDPDAARAALHEHSESAYRALLSYLTVSVDLELGPRHR